ncbi:MAG: nucleoside monophosphate kinase [Cyanobacteria bacterium P01_D01_bin.115]
MKLKQFILLGPPGVGVEKQAIVVAERWCVPHVSTGQLIRDAVDQASDIGVEAHPYVEARTLVPDALVMKLIKQRFEQPDIMLKGWILTGFPRTLAQAQAFDEWWLTVSPAAATAIHLKAKTGMLIHRLSSEPGQGETISTIRQRLEQHEAEIAPLLEYYQQRSQLKTLNGSLPFAEVTRAVTKLGQATTGAAQLIQDEAELDALLSEESLLVVDCMASWCGPCKLVAPLIDQLAEAYGDRVNVRKINFDTNKQIPKRFGLKGLPAVMFFKGGNLLETLTGVQPYKIYSATVTRFLE